MDVTTLSDDRDLKLFNSPLEIGLRALVLLATFEKYSLSLEKMVYYDYFLIHAGDISKKQKSIHPIYPYRSGEVIIKRDLLLNATKLLVGKELIKIVYLPEGIEYKITEIGISVIQYFETEYAVELKNISKWIFDTYLEYDEEKLFGLINKNLQKWGSEFSNESKFRGINL